jgi:hypothetical protein
VVRFSPGILVLGVVVAGFPNFAKSKLMIGLVVSGAEVPDPVQFILPPAPTTADVTPPSVALAAVRSAPIAVRGLNSGLPQADSQLLLDGVVVAIPTVKWQDTEIDFNVPANHPNIAAWSAGKTLPIEVIVAGVQSIAASLALQ